MRRRTFLQGAAAGLGLTALGGRANADLLNIALPSLGVETRPAKTPVKHIVVVMMENRSVDHLLGWYGAENPNFDARQHATCPDLRKPGGPMMATANWGQHGRAVRTVADSRIRPTAGTRVALFATAARTTGGSTLTPGTTSSR